jgi:hypothetical protein
MSPGKAGDGFSCCPVYVFDPALSVTHPLSVIFRTFPLSYIA